ncbi:hypothetical protein NB311A_05278 [Nitrobacter sp. Nb-311A]|nr:hypothetical protein NB311A_05278 [Nitrobacter sp. Nb-311A]
MIFSENRFARPGSCSRAFSNEVETVRVKKLRQIKFMKLRSDFNQSGTSM